MVDPSSNNQVQVELQLASKPICVPFLFSIQKCVTNDVTLAENGKMAFSTSPSAILMFKNFMFDIKSTFFFQKKYLLLLQKGCYNSVTDETRRKKKRHFQIQSPSADDKLIVNHTMDFVLQRKENIVGEKKEMLLTSIFSSYPPPPHQYFKCFRFQNF